MSTTMKRAISTAAVAGTATLTTVGMSIGAAPQAQAAPNTITHEYTRAEVKKMARDNATIVNTTCGALAVAVSATPAGPIAGAAAGAACKLFGANGANGGQVGAVNDAADHDCGLRMVSTPTGSGNSWDKADFSYTKINCLS